jgi:hypothetical protein
MMKELAVVFILGLVVLFGGSYFFFATGEVAHYGKLILTSLTLAFIFIVFLSAKASKGGV